MLSPSGVKNTLGIQESLLADNALATHTLTWLKHSGNFTSDFEVPSMAIHGPQQSEIVQLNWFTPI